MKFENQREAEIVSFALRRLYERTKANPDSDARYWLLADIAPLIKAAHDFNDEGCGQ